MYKSVIRCAVFSSLLLLGSSQNCYAAADFNSHFSAGEKAFAASNFNVAAENFAQALKLVPDDLRSRFRYGQALFSLNRFSESHNQFQTVLQNSPSNIIARIYLAENLIRLNKTSEAQVHLDWILKVQPGHERARQLLAAVKTSASSVVAELSDQPPEKLPANQQPLPVKTKLNPEKNAKKKSKKDFEKAAVSTASAVAGQPQSFEPKPFIANSPTTVVKKNADRSLPLPAAENVADFNVESFLEISRNSFLINLEQARFNIEFDDTRAAAANLLAAEQLARESRDSRRFLEVQVLNSLVFLYNRDFTGFGQHLMKLKSVLSPESYQSFLDIYNQGQAIKDSADQARLVAGIAMGAGHDAVAARLLKEAFVRYPNDILVGSMLVDAQMQSLDYQGAEATLAQMARTDDKNSEIWFNLARFYLTADYRPEQVRSYAGYAASLRPDDTRNHILLALLDYSQGRINEGISRINQLMDSLNDPALKNICERIVADGQAAGAGNVDFVGVLALPGARHAHKSSYRLLGEDYLKSGSFFAALRYFQAAGDVAEIGRTWLGIASALNSSGETALAATAAGYGMKALHHELAANPENARANLYIALYNYERGDKVAARRAVERGLASQSIERPTRNRLSAILEALSS